MTADDVADLQNDLGATNEQMKTIRKVRHGIYKWQNLAVIFIFGFCLIVLTMKLSPL